MKKTIEVILIGLIIALMSGCGHKSSKSSTPAYSISGTVTLSSGLGLTNVTMTLSGTASKTTTTTVSGNYSFSSLVNGGYTITPTFPGYTFSPAFSSTTVSNSNVTGVDFIVKQGGKLDTSFGTNGVVFTYTSLGGYYAYGESITTDTQGRILVTGGSNNNLGHSYMTIWRYNSYGTPDTSFGTNGMVFTNTAAGGSQAYGNSIIMDAQGRILISGVAENSSGNPYMTIWRYNSNGTPDTVFGTNGVVFTNTSAGGITAAGYSIITDAQGKILVTGEAYDSSGNPYMTIWRYNSNGTPDTTFGTNGVVVTNTAAGGNGAWGNSVITDAKGRILISGVAENSSRGYYMTIWRYNSNGTSDTTFGTNGVVVTNTAAGGNFALGGRSLIDASGKILVTGVAGSISGNWYTTIWRYDSNGTPDTSFGTNGVVISANPIGGIYAMGNSITTDAQNRILVTGIAEDSSFNDYMTIWRYNSDGTPDTIFGTNGIVFTNTTAGGNHYAVGNSIIIDAQGRILVTGAAADSSGNTNMTIWRYLP